MASKDATVTSIDLLDVGEEVNGHPLSDTARRLRDLEPLLISFIDANADLIAGRLATAGVGIEHVRHVAAEMRRLGYTIMLAQNRGYFRLWKDAFEPEPPVEDTKKP
jgi:hypothetical protein